jgi:glycosyltransferase involved in cell wall biosynthesis
VDGDPSRTVKISVIVATLHARDQLARLCAECRPLTSCGVELVVVDGGSQDGSERVVSTVPGAHWLSEPDDGVADAWNKALAMATGDWLVFAGADDRLGPTDAWQHTVTVLERMAADVSLVAFAVNVVSPLGSPLALTEPRPGIDLARLKAVNAVPHQGVFARRDVFTRVGRFDTSFRVTADYEWLLRALLAGEVMATRAEHSPVSMTFGGLSTHEPLCTVRELRRAQQKRGVRGPRIAWWLAWARASVRHVMQKVCGRKLAGYLADCGRRLRGLRPVWSVP